MKQLQEPTLLSRPDLSVVEILDEKAKATTPERAVDYIGYTNDYIANQIAQCESEVKEYQAKIKSLKQHQERIKHGVAKWIISNGVEKIEGLKVSSVTFYKPKSTKLVIYNEGYFMDNPNLTKTTLDETAVKEFIGGEIDYSEFAEIKTTLGESLAKINK